MTTTTTTTATAPQFKFIFHGDTTYQGEREFEVETIYAASEKEAWAELELCLIDNAELVKVEAL